MLSGINAPVSSNRSKICRIIYLIILNYLHSFKIYEMDSLVAIYLIYYGFVPNLLLYIIVNLLKVIIS